MYVSNDSFRVWFLWPPSGRQTNKRCTEQRPTDYKEIELTFRLALSISRNSVSLTAIHRGGENNIF